jgi:hypothetical protein
MSKTIKIFNRDIPLTKSGNPNMRYLSSQEKEIWKEYLYLRQKQKKEGLDRIITLIGYTL